MIHADEPRRLLGGLLGLGRHGGHGVPVILRLADRQHGAIAELGSEPGYWLRQVLRRHDQADTGDTDSLGRVDADDPGPGRVDRDQPDVEHVGQPDVGDVSLSAGHPILTAHALGGAADPGQAHDVVSPAACRIAAVICS